MELGQTIQLSPDVLQLITLEQAWHYKIIPFSGTEKHLSCWIDETEYNVHIADELEMILDRQIQLTKSPKENIAAALTRFYRKEEKKGESSGKVYEGKSDDFLQKLISDAKSLGSSDIHVETYEDICRVRIRIDGMLVERYKLNKLEYPTLINKIKIMSNMDIAEKRLPQDGRISFQSDNSKFDIRVSVLPTLHGEKVVMRLLNNDATNIDIAKLGLTEFDLNNYLDGIRKPHGILLISGPTGSGKTTTLYATLKLLNKESRNITTIEDPIEYTLAGVNQVQLKENIGLNFSAALRTFLRQDPDVIMLGEIRDAETASMAIRAALTGHLVLSTIHTNSAWGTVSRLIDMGVPSFLLANTLNTSVAQRLLRKLCPFCKAEEDFDPKLYPRQFKPSRIVQKHFMPKGCSECHFTGYKGRKAVYEVIPVDAEMALNIKNSIFDVSNLLEERGIKTLTENAFELFEKGETSLEEVYPLLFNY